MDKSLASKYFNIGLRKNDPIGFNPDTYERVKEYTGIYAPLLQSITTAGDLALRGVTAAGLGTVGKLGDLTGQKQLSRDLAAMFLSAGGTMGTNLAFTRPMGIKTEPNVKRVDATRVENLPKKTELISTPGEEGLYFKIGEPAYNYANKSTSVFPVVKRKERTVNQVALDVGRKNVKNIQEFEGTVPKFNQIFDDAGNYVGGYYEGGRQIKLPLTRYEKQAMDYGRDKTRTLFDPNYKSKFYEGFNNPSYKKQILESSEAYGLSSARYPATNYPIDRLKTITLNMKPEQRKLFFKRLLNPDARREIMRVYPELTAIPLTALSTIATAAAIKKKD
tara:strand:- start:138 stop:1139 length:1002 start_codon:yes stop_codon:yes gene_type:complete